MEILDYIDRIEARYGNVLPKRKIPNPETNDDSPVDGYGEGRLNTIPKTWLQTMPEIQGLPNPETRIQELATGGPAQLVQPGPGRQGYQGNPQGNPLLGTEYTGTQHKGKISDKNAARLNKLKEIIQESNGSYKKNITAHEALVKAGWKDGYQSIGTYQNIRPEVAKSMKKLLTTQNKIDNYVNNVMLAEDALVKDFRSPQQHIAKKFGVSKSFMDKWAADSKIYKENKKLFTGLRNELSFNKYKSLPDGAPRLIADYSEIIQNKLPYTKSLHRGTSAEKFIMDSAYRHYKYAKDAGKSSQIRFIGNPELLPMNQWQFIKGNKLYSLDPALDDVVYDGTAYKNNYLNHVDAPKLYKNDFGDIYKAFDDLDVYMNTMVDGPDGKPIKLDTLLRRQAYDKTGKKDFLKRRFAELDHGDIMKKPFSDIRLMDRQTNVRAGILKRFDKYKNNPKLLNKTLTDIGYLHRDKDNAAFIKRMTKKAGVIPQEGSAVSFLGTKQMESGLSKFGKSKLGKGVKLFAKGEGLFAPLFLYGGAAYGLPFTRNINEASYGLLGKSKSEYLINKHPKAKTVIDLLDAQTEYNTLLDNYKKATPLTQLQFKNKMLAKQKEFEEKVAIFNAIPEEDKMELGQAYQTAEKGYEDEIKQRRDRHFSNYIIPKKEFFTDIASNISDAFETPVSANENVFGTSIPTGQIQTAFAGGGIASLTRTTPPESGPAPQGEGLSYLLNHVREW
jgi:hypothetical protein